MSGERDMSAAALAAMLSAAVIIAHQVAAKSTRQTLFLSSFRPDSLPVLMIGAALFSIVLVLLTSRAMATAGPARLVPAAFWASGMLHLAEWALSFRFEAAVAVVFYLHFAGLGAVLISGFWSMVSERFDPHTAKKRMGQIAGGGTLGALVGGVMAWRIGATLPAPSMLPILCAMHLFCGWILRTLRPPAGGFRPSLGEAAGDLGAGARLLAKHPYLRHLALLVLLGAAGAAMIEVVFVARAGATVAIEQRLQFFALFYTTASLIGCVVHTALTRLLLDKTGLGVTVSLLPATMVAGSLGAALAPGLASATIARGSEQVIHNSLFRSAYELFYTSVPPAEKRSAKPLIDVGFERLGDMTGAAIGRCLLWLAPGAAHPAMLAAAAGAGLLGIWIARRLDRGYVAALERSLRDRAVELKIEDVEDNTTRATLIRTIADFDVSVGPGAGRRKEARSAPIDPVLGRIADLRSGDPVRVCHALEQDALSPELAAHAIPLLAWDDVAEHAIRALRRAGTGVTGQLIDAMLDGDHDFAIRRRVPRVLSALPSARAVEGLFLALNDKRFEVRFRCGRALATMLDRDAGLSLTMDRVTHAVSRELELGRHLWESHRLLDGCEEDELVGNRAHRGLEHVFTLLSLVLPKEPLRISFRALHTDDEMLRGTALEYLESTLPPPVRERLWPLLEDKRPADRAPRSHEEVLAELLESHASIQVRLLELRASKTPQG